MSNKTLSRWRCGITSCKEYFFVLVYVLFLYVVMQGFFIWEWNKYRFSNDQSELQFSRDNLFFFWLGIFYGPYLLVQQCISKRCTKIIYNINTRVIENGKTIDKKAFGGISQVGIRIGICFVANFFIQALFAYIRMITYVVSVSELYLHAVFGGMTEELFFRGFLQQSIYDVLRSFLFKGKNKIVPGFISISVSSLAFGFAHIPRYGLDPAMIGAPIAAGFVYGIIYFWSDGNVIETMIVHAINNFVATYQQLQAVQQLVRGVVSAQSIIFTIIAIVLCFLMFFVFQRESKNARRKIPFIIPVVSTCFLVFGLVTTDQLFYILTFASIIICIVVFVYVMRDEILIGLRRDVMLVLSTIVSLSVSMIFWIIENDIRFITWSAW